jgi:ribosomal protein L37AE/L43A
MSMRAVPFCCPYCGEEELEPVGEGGNWHCSSCDRLFELHFKGLTNGAA